MSPACRALNQSSNSRLGHLARVPPRRRLASRAASLSAPRARHASNDCTSDVAVGCGRSRSPSEDTAGWPAFFRIPCRSCLRRCRVPGLSSASHMSQIASPREIRRLARAKINVSTDCSFGERATTRPSTVATGPPNNCRCIPLPVALSSIGRCLRRGCFRPKGSRWVVGLGGWQSLSRSLQSQLFTRLRADGGERHDPPDPMET